MNGPTLASLVVQLATVAMAGYGAWRCMQLQRFAKDPRLRALGLFFGLFALAVLALAVWTWQWGAPNPAGFGGGGPGVPTDGTDGGAAPDRPLRAGPDGPRRGPLRPEGAERVNLLLTGHHALMLASLAVGVFAFRRARPSAQAPMAAAVGFGFLNDFIPAILALEAGLTLYLAARAFVNHVERRSPGALQVAIGFALFFLGHLLFLLQHRPGAARTGLGDILGLVGIALLVGVLPGKR